MLKDFSSISLKKFDLDFAVDPLFKKTSADFDEGGARGLLLNHLGMDQHCKIIFDASDATIECDTDELDGEVTHNNEEEEEEEKAMEEEEVLAEEKEAVVEPELEAMDIDEDKEKSPTVDELPPSEEPEKKKEEPEKEEPQTEPISSAVEEPAKGSLVEISRLKGTFAFIYHDLCYLIFCFTILAKLPTFEALSALNIVPSLKGFDFFSEHDLEIPNLDHDDDDLPIENLIDDKEEEAFHFDDYDIDYGADDIDPFAFDENNDNQEEEEEDQHEIDNTEKGYPEQDYLQAMLNNGEQELFNYFDTTLNTNWAGPEHWKLRRPPPPAEKCKLIFVIYHFFY